MSGQNFNFSCNHFRFIWWNWNCSAVRWALFGHLGLSQLELCTKANWVGFVAVLSHHIIFQRNSELCSRDGLCIVLKTQTNDRFGCFNWRTCCKQVVHWVLISEWGGRSFIGRTCCSDCLLLLILLCFRAVLNNSNHFGAFRKHIALFFHNKCVCKLEFLGPACDAWPTILTETTKPSPGVCYHTVFVLLCFVCGAVCCHHLFVCAQKYLKETKSLDHREHFGAYIYILMKNYCAHLKLLKLSEAFRNRVHIKTCWHWNICYVSQRLP